MSYVISPGSGVETRVYYNTEIGKWRATYNLGGVNWAILGEEDIGFSIADHAYNLGDFSGILGNIPLIPALKVRYWFSTRWWNMDNLGHEIHFYCFW